MILTSTRCDKDKQKNLALLAKISKIHKLPINNLRTLQTPGTRPADTTTKDNNDNISHVKPKREQLNGLEEHDEEIEHFMAKDSENGTDEPGCRCQLKRKVRSFGFKGKEGRDI
ncbi:hypothetical protein Tco_1275862 [Tanacetum coccineum]